MNDTIENKVKVIANNVLQKFWNLEILIKKLTGLPVDLYVITARETKYPLRVFVPDSYNNPKALYAVSISKHPEFLEDIHNKLLLKPSDIDKIFTFIKYNSQLFIDLSNADETIMWLELQLTQHGKTLNESWIHCLNEQANLDKRITKLPNTIWIDMTQEWKAAGHSYRFKIQSQQTKQWIPVLLPSCEIPDSIASNLTKADKKVADDIKKWVAWNMDIFDMLQYKPYNEAERSNDFLNNNITILYKNKPVFPLSLTDSIQIVYETPTYQIIQKVNTLKFNILWNNDLIGKYWCDKINVKSHWSDIHNMHVFDVIYKGEEHVILSKTGELI